MASGGSGGGKGNDASGGITPEQMSLTQFTLGENLLKNSATFGKSSTGASTMHTMADAGSMMNQALQAQQISQADAAALNAFNNQQQQQKGQTIGGIGSLAGGLGGSLGGTV